jgi:hypothetical protein
MNNHDEKQVGSNLTGAAIPGKPGHQRDIPIDQHIEGHIENTDALLGDVDLINGSDNSPEESQAKKENGT